MAATRNGVRLWPCGKIPFEPFDSHPHRDAILSAMGQIEQQTNIWFGKRGSEPNYLNFIVGTHNYADGLARPTTPGPRTVSITGHWWALHELLHAAGLIHEHERSDRDDYLFDIENPPGKENSSHLTEFDRLSVMLYSKPMIPQATWKPNPNLTIGADDRTKLSALDLAGLRKLYKDTAWSSPKAINAYTPKRPALTYYKEKLYLVTGRIDGKITYSYCLDDDYIAWTVPAEISGADAKGLATPSVTVFKDHLYAAWMAEGRIQYSRFNGLFWSDIKKPLSNMPLQDMPVLAASKDKIYMAWTAPGGAIYCTWSSDGLSWNDPTKLPSDATTSLEPALVIHDSHLFVAWLSSMDWGVYYSWASLDKMIFSGRYRAGTTSVQFGAKRAPAFISFPDPYEPKSSALYLAWPGYGDSELWWAHMRGGWWSGQARLSTYTTIQSASFAVRGNRLVLGWPGSDGQLRLGTLNLPVSKEHESPQESSEISSLVCSIRE